MTTTTVLMRSNGDILWFDAILSFTKNYTAQVTKHPIERGGVVSDHVTLDNISFQLSGVISNADFNTDRLDNEAQNSLYEYLDDIGTGRINIVNNSPLEDGAEITYQENPLTKYLPEAAAAFLDQSAPTVSMTEAFKLTGAGAMENYFTLMQRGKELFTVLEIFDNVVRRYEHNCVFTNVSFTVDPESGDAVYPNLTFESVVFVESALVKIPKKVTDKLKKKSESKQNKGAQSGTKSEGDAPKEVPKRVSAAKQARDKSIANEAGPVQ